MSLTPEQIEENFRVYRGWFEKLGERAPAALAMIDALDERIALCPASAKRDFHAAYPGGYCEHSLRVLSNTMKVIKAFGWETTIPKESIIIGALLHDHGKIGNVEHAYYVPQTDSWRQDKLGEMFTHNKALEGTSYMDVPQRGLFLCQHFGLKLTHEETLCILLNDGFVVDANKRYCLKAPKLVFAVQTGDYSATCQEKGVF